MIEIAHLQKVIDQNTAIDIEELCVAGKEISAISGPAGSGKSVLMALLCGQTRPTSGTVRICGLEPARDRKGLSQRLGVLFAENGLYERMSARANLAFHCRLRGLPAWRADEVLEQVGLVDHASTLARRLPPGLARRLAFGRAILTRPQALLLMDPFADCDAPSSTLLARLMRQRADEGSAILILAADTGGLAHVCSKIYMLEAGRIVRSFSPQEEHRSGLPFKIPSRQEGQVVLVNPADLLYASAEEGQTTLHTLRGPVPSHLTLTELEERLTHNGFFRAHRAYLVNLQRVKAVIPYTRDSYTLVLDDPAGTEIPLSKTAARELRDLLGY